MTTILSVQEKYNNYKAPMFKQHRETESYLNKESTVDTNNLTHPARPQGHLVNDSFENSFKYFFKDIKYNLKSVKDGFNGTANDHQLGRLNDVGLVTAGVLIATYLASKTNNPKTRLMEYIGLGAFLTAMAVYPKIAINTPAKLVHGYEIDKEYIDDQGRKKSVMQDPNYVPYDMYQGDVPEESISLIGDKMGIPRDIANRDALIREQMRKLATQNNTLWMLTACVTPALTGLMCYGIENYIAEPLVEKAKLAKLDHNLSNILQKTADMSGNIERNSLKQNSLSKNVESILSNYKGKELPQTELDNLLRLLTEDLFANTSEGIKADINRILKSSAENAEGVILITKDTSKNLSELAKNSISINNKKDLEKILVPSKEELDAILKKLAPSNGETINVSNINQFKEELSNLLNTKIQSSTGITKEFLESRRSKIVESLAESLLSKKANIVSDDKIKQISDFAKIIGEFKDNQASLKKIGHALVEDESNTVIANAYGKFEKTLLDVLEIKYKDLKKMGESEAFTKELLDKKLSELCKNEAKYEKAIEKFGKVISEMEIKLNGNSETKSRLLDLITATENNYNHTAQRLSKLGSFSATIDKLVKEDVETLGNSLKDKKQLFDFIDGIIESKYKSIGNWDSLKEEARVEYLKQNSKGVGSSKRMQVSRIIERYQGAKNSLNRMIHTFDIYKRAEKPNEFLKIMGAKDSEYTQAIIKEAKEALLNASTSDHFLKLNMVNNPNFYKDFMRTVYAGENGDRFSTKYKGFLDEATKRALGKKNSITDGNVLDRLQYAITRAGNLIANSTVDFTKPDHIVNPYVRKSYTMDSKTRSAFFNIVGQTPTDLVQNAAKKRYSTQKWLRKVGILAGSITGVAVLSQFFFGKISNPQNVKKIGDK